MAVADAIDLNLAANLIGFTIGVVISLLLLVLTVRAAKLPGTPTANIALAGCSFLWNAGGLLCTIQNPMPMTGWDRTSVAAAIQFTGAAIWPIPMLAIWRHLATGKWQDVCWRYLKIVALLNALVIVIGFWVAVAGRPMIPVMLLKELSSYGATFLGLLAAEMFLRGRSVSRGLRFSAFIVLIGLLVSTLSVMVHNVNMPFAMRCLVGVTSQQAVLLVEIGTFFLFAKFRFADLFIRYSIRIMGASIAAGIVVLTVSASFIRQIAARGGHPRAMLYFLTTIVVTGLLVCFAPLDRIVRKVVNEWVFQAPDYRNAVRALGETLRRIYGEPEVTAAVEKAIRHALALEDVQAMTLSRLPEHLWPMEIHEGQVAELGQGSPLASLLSLDRVELLVPVRAEGRVTSVLAISPGPARRGLVSVELNYLRSAAEQYGSRLDLLRLEREMVERQSREALLLQQVTEAELRALRAQINPHFLFNSLNTIANLIVADPARAEVMTLRLAKVFRHVLAHSSRPLTPIREEIEFLRAYLEIEEARFGSRLQVDIDIAPEVAHDSVPSLILQPVVENALKHGLAPKTGPGRLWISAKNQGDRICLEVEDDGVGPDGSLGKTNVNSSHGVGLKNITQRLTTLYQERAQVTLESRNPEGTRVTLLLPRDYTANGNAKSDR
jgi:two-component system, LytTR family, sensor kinase